MEYAFRKSRNQYAIGMLEEFFDYYGLGEGLRYTDRLVYYALHWKCYKEREPYSMIFLGDWLKRLLAACFVLENEFRYSDNFTVIIPEKTLPDLNNTRDYMPDRPGFEWYYLPRHISVPQYLNPMKVFKKMVKYKTEAGWFKMLDDFVEYSLSNCSIDGSNPGYNMMLIRTLLLQIVEASHLVLVRYDNYQQGTAEEKLNVSTQSSEEII